ncbi:hypothetical protein BDV18DRAFT_151535 [Aspergillus unguis]
MAMGQAEQRAIHPFFQKGFGAPAPLVQPVDALAHPPDSNDPDHASHASVAALDYDPNTDRRKRRKIEDDAVEHSNSNVDVIESGPGTIESDPSANSETDTPGTTTPRALVAVENTSALESQLESQPSQISTDGDNLPEDQAGQRKQKVIKLNANGKLLSSPGGDKSKKGNKRGRPTSQKPQHPASRLVVITYNVYEGDSKRLGQQIEEILSGNRKHTTPKAAPRTALPRPASNQPPKATHPFFLKKTARSDRPQPECPISAPTEDGPTNKLEHTHSRPAPTPLFSFKHAFTKVPEPVHPLWPPLGLTHIRDVDYESASNDNYNPSDTDLRKSKSPAVQVNDEESVLLLSKNLGDACSALRIPGKQVVGGRSLQTEVAKRLSTYGGSSNADGLAPQNALHPALSKLYVSLPFSMTPFDNGGYETHLWANKYAPTSAQQVLCATKEALMLRDWLKHLIVSRVDSGNTPKDSGKAKRSDEKKRKRRKKAEMDDFIVDEEDEANEMGEISGSDDELAGDVTVSNKRTVIRTGDLTFNLRSNSERSRMTNVILLSGPSGCGKTASVYAVAKEMDFEVFEINPGSRRSAKDILDRIGDMTQNHLVHNIHDNEDPSSSQTSGDPQVEDAKQNKLMGFFKPGAAVKEPGRPKTRDTVKDTPTKQNRSQKQSLILLEEADILFDEDKQFWNGVITLINQSKRPIVITCNDENLIPLGDISFHAILRFRAPSQDLAVDYLLLMAATEGHMLARKAVEKLYTSNRRDLRKSIMDLNYWCQMGVGSEKSGLDWLLDRWPQGIDLDTNGDKLRVLSADTYSDHMGWFSRDISMSLGLTSEAELRQEALHWWQLSLQEADTMEDSQLPLALGTNVSKSERLESLRRHSEYMDSRSALDVLSAACSLDVRKDSIDTTVPPIPEKQKQSYIQCYQLLHADHVPDYTALAVEIGSTFQSLVGRVFRQTSEADSKKMLPTMLESVSKPRTTRDQQRELLEVMTPAIKPGCGAPQPGVAAGLVFEYGQRSIAEDLTPYVRGIVAFDLRLEQYRRELSRVLSGNETSAKRMRTTRSSRAALEGGNKAETRKERWFSPAVNEQRVLATGKKEWQDLLVQNGYFSVPIAGEQEIREESLLRSFILFLCNCLSIISVAYGNHPLFGRFACLLSPTELRLFASPPALPSSHRSSSMSLFGTSPDESSAANSASRSKVSLFADEPSFGGGTGTPNFGGSSLFADDDSLGSPWSNNTAKRTSKQQLVKTLLPDSDVPESYIDAYDLVLSAGERAGASVGLTSVRELLAGSGVSATDQSKILNLVLSGDTDRPSGLGRGEFNVLLALTGLAQEGEDLTFDTVDDRRKNLPLPNSSYLDGLRAKQDPAMSAVSHGRPTTPPAPSAPVQEPSSVRSRRSGRNSIGGLEADPWGSPDMHRGHNHAQAEPEHGVLNGFGSVRSTTNAWSKTSDGGSVVGAPNSSRPNGRPEEHTSSSAESGWGDHFGQPSDGAGLGGSAQSNIFGQPGGDQGEPNPGRRSLNIGRSTSSQIKEVVTVTLLQEKEGLFMFQHRNYEVKSARRGSTVVRRYSDFVWLLDCLHKRYPFRQLPLLPPKRLAVNGTHLAADSTSFLEKRRRGLVRFTNSLVQHPVLSQEQLVVMFLTVPTELSVWRKQATISVQDEFAGRVLPPDLEDSLPSTLIDTFDTVRGGVKRSAEVYINLCTLLERLAKRNEGLAADHLRFSLALQSLTEMTKDTYAVDTNDVPLLNEGIKATARHLSASQSLLEDEARAWEDGMLEDLKRQRDNLVSVREMFDRRDRYARNNIPQLEKRIETNERKLQDLRAKPQGTVKPGEIEKVEESIFKDKESIVLQHARGVFIKECIRDELVYFQQSQYHISRLHQDWSQERVKYSELQADNWRSLGDQVEGMPLGD